MGEDVDETQVRPERVLGSSMESREVISLPNVKTIGALPSIAG